VRKGKNFGQSIWDTKSGAIGSIMRNTLGSCGTPWELYGKTWKQKKTKKIFFQFEIYTDYIFFQLYIKIYGQFNLSH
jgi:hypothetical protein